MCPYEHGSDHMIMTERMSPQTSSHQQVLTQNPLAYDPTNATLAIQPSHSPAPFIPQQHLPQPHPSHPFPASTSNRGNLNHTRGAPSPRGRNHRASFSAAGPNHDPRNTSIVVEQIPEDKFSHEALSSFFSAFGPIADINLQAHKRLAVIKFETYDGAKRAYESPKVIFDNRFVKVYWYRPGSDQVQHSTLAAMEGRAPSNGAADRDTKMSETNIKREDHDHDAEEETPSPEAIAARQAEAQRAHEAKAKKLKEAEDAKSEIDNKLRAAAEERRKLTQRLAARTGSAKSATTAQSPPSDTKSKAEAVNGTPAPASHDAGKGKATEALRAKLAALEAEAEAMGLPVEEGAPFPPYAGYAPRGGGGFRGRGRGRGGFTAQPTWWQGGSVQRLDNRPKTVCVRVIDEDVDFKDEAVSERLRGFLYVSISPLLRGVV